MRSNYGNLPEEETTPDINDAASVSTVNQPQLNSLCLWKIREELKT